MNKENDSIKLCLDAITDENGYNLNVFKVIILTAFVIFCDGFYISHFNFLISGFKSFYEVSNFSLQLISSLSFVGMGVGSFFSGILTKKFSRVYINISCLFLTLILHFLFCLIHNVYLFSFCRFAISLLNGIMLPLQLNILTEYLPCKMRSFVLNFIWISNGFGTLFFLYMCKIYYPTLEYDKTKPLEGQDFHKAIFQNVYILIINIILFIFFLNDSPRNLLIKEEYEEANKSLYKLSGVYYTDEQLKEFRRKLLEEKENKFYNKDLGYKEIFQKRILYITILMFIAYFFISFGRYGMFVVYPEILKKINTENNLPSHQSINNLLVAVFITFIGNFIGGILSEIEGIGRKISEIFFFSLAFVSGILGFVIISKMYIFMGISIASFYSAYKLHITYTEEIYPTIIKDYAMGAMLFSTRCGGFLAQFFYLSLLSSGNSYIITAYCLCCTILVILVIFLPIENTRSLDNFMVDEPEMEKDSINKEEGIEYNKYKLEKDKFLDEEKEKLN